MYKHLKIRGTVLFALVFAIVAFILSLLVLLAGSTPSFLLDSYIVLYDTSSLATAQASSNTTTTTTTTTAIYDWYSFYYLSVCYGSWTTSPNPSGRSKTNISCAHQAAGYQLSLANYLPDDAASILLDSDSYTVQVRDPAAYLATWLAGAIAAGIAAALLPIALRGRAHMNGYIVFILTLADLALLAGAILTTLDALELAETDALYSPLCLGLMWAAVACTLAASGAEFAEWTFQRFTPKGETVGAAWRARYVPRADGGSRAGRWSTRFGRRRVWV